MSAPPLDLNMLSPELKNALGEHLLRTLTEGATSETRKLLWNVTTAVEETGLPRSTIYELAAAGVIPCVRIGRRVLIPREQFLHWIAEQVQAGGGGTA